MESWRYICPGATWRRPVLGAWALNRRELCLVIIVKNLRLPLKHGLRSRHPRKLREIKTSAKREPKEHPLSILVIESSGVLSHVPGSLSLDIGCCPKTGALKAYFQVYLPLSSKSSEKDHSEGPLRVPSKGLWDTVVSPLLGGHKVNNFLSHMVPLYYLVIIARQ